MKLSMALLVSLLVGAMACSSEPADTASTVSSATSPPATAPSTEAVTTIPPVAWIPLSRMLVPRSEVPAALVDDLIYVPGGFAGRGALQGTEQTVEVYDTEADMWEFVADMPEPRHHLMAAGLGGKLYVLGGYTADWNPTDTTWVYDPASDRWSTETSMPFPVAAGAAVALGDHLYVLGGVPRGTSLLRFDPVSTTWEELASMSEAREHVSAAVADGLIYVVAGRWHDVGERTSGEIFDPELDGWSPLPDLTVPRGGHAVAALDDMIVAIGGEVLNTGEALTDVEAYDLSTGTWAPWPSLPVGLHGVPAVVGGGGLFVLGGSKVGRAVVNDGTTYRWAG